MDNILINPTPGTLVEHYKGGRYKVLNIALHCDDKREHVVYMSLKDATIWIRPLSEFRDMVQTEDGLIKRFKEII